MNFPLDQYRFPETGRQPQHPPNRRSVRGAREGGEADETAQRHRVRRDEQDDHIRGDQEEGGRHHEVDPARRLQRDMHPRRQVPARTRLRADGVPKRQIQHPSGHRRGSPRPGRGRRQVRHQLRLPQLQRGLRAPHRQNRPLPTSGHRVRLLHAQQPTTSQGLDRRARRSRPNRQLEAAGAFHVGPQQPKRPQPLAEPQQGQLVADLHELESEQQDEDLDELEEQRVPTEHERRRQVQRQRQQRQRLPAQEHVPQPERQLRR